MTFIKLQTEQQDFQILFKKCFTWIIFDVVYLADGAF